MPALTEGLRVSDWLKGEQQQPTHFSRENVTVLAGDGSDRELTTGMVLGRIKTGDATAEADAGNTGAGEMGAITVGAGAVAGDYTLEIVEADTNAGRFVLKDPAGKVVGEGNVGSAFSGGGLSFTLADGDPDFAVGDSFVITVEEGSLKVVPIDFSGDDGTQDAAGVLLDDVTAPDGVDAEGVAIVRNAVISANQLVWPSGATAAQKAAALAQLAEAGVVARVEV